MLMQQNLEARVGIGRLMPCFQGKTTPLPELIQYNLALFGLTPFNPLTEDFTEGLFPKRNYAYLLFNSAFEGTISAAH